MNDFLERTKKISHVTASLYSHLVGTSELLKLWGARKALCSAGLYHSMYSTEGFKPRLINHRSELKEIIGEEAEEIVYYFFLISNKNLVFIYKKRGWVAIFDKFEPFVSNNAFRKYKDVFV